MGAIRAVGIALIVPGLAAPALAQNVEIAGVWRAVEGSPSQLGQPVSSSDAQTLELSVDGQYRRTVTVEGGDGGVGVGGRFVDTGSYSFSAPSTFQYARASYTLCTALACLPYQPPPPNQGSLAFELQGNGQASFLGLSWTKIQ